MRTLLHTFSQARHDERGFTIVEVLVSLLIFSVAVTGVISVAAQGGLNVNASKLSLTATYLAGEGVELMRAMRDNAVLGGATPADGWDAFTGTFGASVCTLTAPCDIDPTILSTPFPSVVNVVACPTGPGLGFCTLYQQADGLYGTTAPTGGTASPYSRQIIVVPVSGTTGDEQQITVKVRYKVGTSTKTITVSENLFNLN